MRIQNTIIFACPEMIFFSIFCQIKHLSCKELVHTLGQHLVKLTPNINIYFPTYFVPKEVGNQYPLTSLYMFQI